MTFVVLVGGLLASLAFSAVIFTSYFWCPEVWISEITEGKETGGSAFKGGIIVAGTLIAMVGGAAGTAWWYGQDAAATYWQLFLVAWLVLFIVNLWDLVVIDIVVYMWIYPSFMQWEGYEPLHRYWPHVKGSLVGAFPLGIPLAAFSAWLAYLWV